MEKEMFCYLRKTESSCKIKILNLTPELLHSDTKIEVERSLYDPIKS